eukprot:CAMPEP_0201738874 /NCGR_PEP_ID=MMETSP0593-20130828/45481_1 /ASSEMBLY_ACC=CAM_ASM_000672 /TAXON_ID=267983 /ORGANISM="Skeletonema japonicum, Strain CCMP2506" /LENGTH=301 /DNA_ID=CAMNT_0048233105 /DNA_START=96 /DNA_END=1001 /DNA_ORIENTATION=-
MSSNDSSFSHDSVIILFLLGWGFIFVGAFVKSAYLCTRRRFCGYEGGRIGEEETPECYRNMSFARQEEIDNLRKSALLRNLNRYTLTLGDEHLICCSGSQSDITLSTSTSDVNDESVTSDESCKDVEGSGDVEEGNSEYTHISIPLPGCEMTGTSICTIEARKESRQEGSRCKLPSLFQTRNDEGREKSQTQTEPVTITDKPSCQLQTVEKRRVPIFCAICLSEYEKCDRVCWSSNIECSHVFHEDCVLQWLTSSGKKRSMSQHFTEHPTDAELLKNEFCPCCRQDFICVKQALLGSEENV